MQTDTKEEKTKKQTKRNKHFIISKFMKSVMHIHEKMRRMKREINIE